MVQGTRANSLTGTCSDPHRPGSQRSGQVLLGPQGWRPPAPSRGEPGWTGRLQMTGGQERSCPYSPGFQDRVELGLRGKQPFDKTAAPASPFPPRGRTHIL